MAYCVQSDIEKAVTAEVVVELSDDDADGTADTAVVAWAIEAADELIDGKLNSRYAVPFTTVPPLIKHLSADLAAYNLALRRQRTAGSIEERYKAAIKLLEALAEGSIALIGIALASGKPAVSKDVDADRKFTMGRDDSGTTGTLDNY